MTEQPPLGRTEDNPYWEMFKLIEASDRLSTTDIARTMRISVRTAREKLKTLRASGFIFCDGRDVIFRKSPRHADGTWTARNVYGAGMRDKPFPVPRKPWPRGDS